MRRRRWWRRRWRRRRLLLLLLLLRLLRYTLVRMWSFNVCEYLACIYSRLSALAYTKWLSIFMISICTNTHNFNNIFFKGITNQIGQMHALFSICMRVYFLLLLLFKAIWFAFYFIKFLWLLYPCRKLSMYRNVLTYHNRRRKKMTEKKSNETNTKTILRNWRMKEREREREKLRCTKNGMCKMHLRLIIC